MCGGSPSAPAPPPKLPEAPQLPDTRSSLGRKNKGRSRSTILTTPRGVENDSSTTAQKTLLGE